MQTILSAFLLFCFGLGLMPVSHAQMVDPNADTQVQNLYQNLWALQGNGIMFGHQDDLAYGIGWKGGRKRSDVQKVSGQYPAVFGWELSKLGQRNFNIDTVKFRRMKKWMRRGYEMGGIIAISWHLDNPVSGGDSWDRTPAVPSILPGGEHHDWFKMKLGLVAEFVQSVPSSESGKSIPIVFRPFHEHNGGWFWWGRPHRTPKEYIELWQYTVHYLRDTLGVHNLLYAYSTDVVETADEYLLDYPGDEYVDIMGMDDYADFRPGGDPARLASRLQMLGTVAEEHGKLFALTETGSETIPDPAWWTERLLPSLQTDSLTRKTSWVMVWRNGRPDHYYAPYPGQGSAQDFIRFVAEPSILMVEDLPDLYAPAVTP